MNNQGTRKGSLFCFRKKENKKIDNKENFDRVTKQKKF
jgi:hypothetical protein